MIKHLFARSLYGRSFAIIWKNSVLWFFGFFATLAVGQGVVELVTGLTSQAGATENPVSSIVAFFSETGISSITLGSIMAAFAANPSALLSFVFAGAVFFALGVFVVWLATLAQGAILSASARAREGKLITFENCLVSGMSRFWQLFGLAALKKLSIAALVVAMVYVEGRIAVYADRFATTLFFLLLMLVLAVLFFVTLLIMVALADVMRKDHTVREALGEAERLFTRHWLAMFEVAVTLFVYKVVAFFAVVFLPTVCIIALGSGLIGAYVQSSFGIALITLVVLTGPVLLLGIFAAFFTAFELTVWAEFYELMHTSSLTSTLLRWTGHLKRASL